MEKIEEFEDLIDNYGYALLAYENSQTITRSTYLEQEQSMYTAKNALLNKISDLLSKQN